MEDQQGRLRLVTAGPLFGVTAETAVCSFRFDLNIVTLRCGLWVVPLPLWSIGGFFFFLFPFCCLFCFTFLVRDRRAVSKLGKRGLNERLSR